MAQEKMPSKSAGRPLGATGEAVRENIAHVRGEQKLAVTELSARMTDVGRPIPTLGLHRIESGDRRVDVDDLIALAVALKVSPVTLLMPKVDSAEPEDRVEMTGTDPSGPPVLIPAQAVWEWLTAQRPIVRTVDLLAFGARSWPKWVREHVARQIREDEQMQNTAHIRLMDEIAGGGRRKQSDGDD